MQKIFVVIPTVRSLDCLKYWKNEFEGVYGVIVEDSPSLNIEVPKNIFRETYHYSWKEIDKELGKKSWIIPRKTSAIRSFGFYKAFKMGADYIITIDDDVYPKEKNFIGKHIFALNRKIPKRWFPTNPFYPFWYTRGFPYLNCRREEQVVVNHGMWNKNLDLDAPTHLLNLGYQFNNATSFSYFVPKKYYFPLCIMNVSFTKDVTPLFYMLLMGRDRNLKPFGFERFDDIWAGILMKKVLDHLGLGVMVGSPIIDHKKASDPFENLQKEARGIKYNEEFWKIVDKVKLTKDDPISCYRELIKKAKLPKEDYFILLKKAILEWLELFE